MGKKISCLFFALILIFSICVINVGATNNTEEKTIKKIVSIVYDDSGSMDNDNEDWAYASYSLQNLIGLMSSQDDLSVVKMTNPYQIVGFDLSTNTSRSEDIKLVEGWGASGDTPFEAVQTAVDWLKSKKSGYADSQAVEYWLVIITDGSFDSGYPSSLTNYLNELKDSMGNSKFEGIFVAIGNSVPDSVKKDWASVTGNHLITASNSDDIVNAMSDVSGLILGQGGKSTDVNVTTTPDGKSITFTSSFPLKKFIVYEQNQSVGITSVQVNGTTVKPTADFTAKKPGTGEVTSRTIQCESVSSDFIPAGQITVNFDSAINTATKNFKILTDSAVEVDLKILDKAGNEIKDLENTSIVEGDFVDFVATVTSSVDKSPINLKSWANEVSAQLIVNEQMISMEYNPNDNTFYGSFQVKSGSNIAYSTITLPGYFRAKSDVINLYPIEVINNVSVSVSSSTFNVPYKYCEDFEEVGALEYIVTGGTMNGICDFEFKNMPKGITASVNGIFADDNGNLSVKIRNDMPAEVKFYRNKEYRETEKSTIGINVTSKQYVLNWEEGSITEIVVNPVKREITLEAVKTKEGGNLTLNDFDGQAVYVVSVLGNGEYLSKEELSSLKFDTSELDGIELSTDVIEYNGKYALQVICNKTALPLFVETGDLSTDVIVTTEYDETSEPTKLTFHIKDSLTKYILPLLLIILIILLIGYLPGIKKRIPNKKYHIQANGEAEAIYVKIGTRLLPYVAEKGSGSDLSLIATSNKNKVSVVNDFYSEQRIFLDGEPIEEGVSRFDLPLGSELKISESNRETVYIYCETRGDDSFGDDFSGWDDTDDLFGNDRSTTKGSMNSDDDFFN
jgi:hypothetical protein